MATDTTEPKIKRIVQISVLSIMLLIATYYGLRSYFHQLIDEEVHTKIEQYPPESLLKLRKQEKEMLEKGPFPIEKAKAFLAHHPREEAGEVIAPQPSTDLDPLKGWVQAPRPVPDFFPKSEQSTDPKAAPPLDSTTEKH